MELMEKILLERITDPGQLTPADQERVKADPSLLAAIQENLALGRLRGGADGAPDREQLLWAAKDRLNTDGGHTMSMIERLFNGKKWYFQLGAAMLLLAAVTLLALLPRSSSWAETPGYVLKFDFGPVEISDDLDQSTAVVEEKLAGMEAAVKEWAEARKAERTDPEQRSEISINVNLNDEGLTALVSLPGEDKAVLESLAAALAKVPGLPAPTITEATWFHANGMLDPNAGLTFNIMDHIFSFPKGSSEEEIENTINHWLRENKPEFKGDVEVTIERTGGDGEEDERVAVAIKINDGEDK